jgi:hypothetical protein
MDVPPKGINARFVTATHRGCNAFISIQIPEHADGTSEKKVGKQFLCGFFRVSTIFIQVIFSPALSIRTGPDEQD